MKGSFALLLLVIATNYSYGQKTSDKPFKSATKVILQNTSSAQDNFRVVGQKLIDLNYYIGQKDTQFNTMESKAIMNDIPGGRSFIQILYITAKDSSIIVTTRSKNKFSLRASEIAQKDYDFDPVHFGDSYKGEPAFDHILDVLKGIDHKSIIYSE